MAVSLLREMKAVGIPTDAVTYGSLIDACGRSGETDRIFPIFDEMEADDLNPNSVCYKLALWGFKAKKDWDGVRKTLSRIRKAFPKNLVYLRTMHIDALCEAAREGEAELALEVLSYFHCTKLLIDDHVLKNVVKACLEAGKGSLAQELREIIEASKNPNVSHSR